MPSVEARNSVTTRWTMRPNSSKIGSSNRDALGGNSVIAMIHQVRVANSSDNSSLPIS